MGKIIEAADRFGGCKDAIGELATVLAAAVMEELARQPAPVAQVTTPAPKAQSLEGGEIYLSNAKAFVKVDPEAKSFYGGELGDPYNEPRFYNTTRRSFRKALAALQAAWTDDMSMYQAMDVLGVNGIRTHSYCAID